MVPGICNSGGSGSSCAGVSLGVKWPAWVGYVERGHRGSTSECHMGSAVGRREVTGDVQVDGGVS